MKNLTYLKIYFWFIINSLCDVAQKIKEVIYKNVKKNFFNILFIFFIICFSILIFRGTNKIYNLSNRIGTTETLLQQYRGREETNIRNLETANKQLQCIGKQLEQSKQSIDNIRNENFRIRKQLNSSIEQIKNSRKYTTEISGRLESQSISINDGRAIIDRVEKRGKIE